MLVKAICTAAREEDGGLCKVYLKFCTAACARPKLSAGHSLLCMRKHQRACARAQGIPFMPTSLH